MDEILNNPAALGAIGLVLLVLVAVIAFKAGGAGADGSSSKKSAASAAGRFPGRSTGGANNNNIAAAAAAKIAKVVWLEDAEGSFANAFEYQARKGMRDGALRELMIQIIKGWNNRMLGGLVLKHPSGRETQVFKFQGGQNVDGKPYLAVDYVSFTSDKRRTRLFLDGFKVEEMTASNDEVFELARKHILSYKEGGRKTCQKSNLALRTTFLSPIQTVE